MPAGRVRAIVVAAAVCGVVVAWLALTSEHTRPRGVWAAFGALVGWSFIATGLYASRRRPESRTGTLMVVLGFAWFGNGLSYANSPLLYSLSPVFGGLWGGVFLQISMAFPSGRLTSGLDRALVIAGYLIFTVASLPGLLFSDQHDGCDDCPENVLMIRDDSRLADAAFTFEALLYFSLFAIVLVRLALRWRHRGPLERLQLTPVYVCGLGTFLLVTAAQAGAGDAFWVAGFVATALLPFAFLAGLLRSHIAQLWEELRSSRVRLVEASDTERRRLERNLHDGAQARLLGVLLLVGQVRGRVDGEAAAMLDRAHAELKTSLAELRELARGIHPAVLSEKGLGAALNALASRAPVPVALEASPERLPAPVEAAAYFVVSEALANVAKYSQATAATVTVRRANGRVMVLVTDDGIGGADAARGSGLRGLADRVAALDGTLSVESPAGRGTRLQAEIPIRR